jgi:hypothetical protein
MKTLAMSKIEERKAFILRRVPKGSKETVGYFRKEIKQNDTIQL